LANFDVTTLCATWLRRGSLFGSGSFSLLVVLGLKVVSVAWHATPWFGIWTTTFMLQKPLAQYCLPVGTWWERLILTATANPIICSTRAHDTS